MVPNIVTSPMLEAAKNKDYHKLQELILNGESVNQKNKNGTTPLLLAIPCKKCVQLLLDSNALNLSDLSGKYPSDLAFETGYPSLAEMILEKQMYLIDNDLNSPHLSLADEDEFQELFTCSICLDSIDGINQMITSCNHNFHSQCLHQWLGNNSSCPMCRAQLFYN